MWGDYRCAVTTLEAAIRDLVRESGAASVALVAGPVGGPRSVELNADEAFYAASTMKVPVLVELYRRAGAGSISLDEPIVVRNAFASIADGSPYALDPGDDSEPSLYARLGDRIAARELGRVMITHSSNLATNLLVERLGAGAIDATMRDLGLPGLRIRRGVEDKAAFAAGLNSTVTAGALAGLLERIADGSAAPPAACLEMLDVLAAQAFNEGIPAGLPPGVRIAHKTGWIPGLYHDAAIVWPTAGRPHVLVILTRGLEEMTVAPALVARLAALVFRSGMAPGAAGPG